MKLTKKKLEQLIMEEISYFRPVKDEGKPKKFPHYADKLSALAGSGTESYMQAQELSSDLHQGEDYDPIDVPMELKDIETMKFTNDDDRITIWQKWMNSNGYGTSSAKRLRSLLRHPFYGKKTVEKRFDHFIDKTKDYKTHNAVVAAYNIDYIPFLDETTGEALPLGSSRPFRGTNTYY